MSVHPVKYKWRVRPYFAFPLDPEGIKRLPEGSEFEAPKEDVKDFEYMLECLGETGKDERRRGRPPKNIRAFTDPPEDRAL